MVYPSFKHHGLPLRRSRREVSQSVDRGTASDPLDAIVATTRVVAVKKINKSVSISAARALGVEKRF